MAFHHGRCRPSRWANAALRVALTCRRSIWAHQDRWQPAVVGAYAWQNARKGARQPPVFCWRGWGRRFIWSATQRSQVHAWRRDEVSPLSGQPRAGCGPWPWLAPCRGPRFAAPVPWLPLLPGNNRLWFRPPPTERAALPLVVSVWVPPRRVVGVGGVGPAVFIQRMARAAWRSRNGAGM